MTAAAGIKGDCGQTSLPIPHVPFDLVEEILCRLSVKYLIQLCCVCKSLNSQISHHSDFAKKYLHFSTSCPDRHHLVVSPFYTPHKFHLCDSPISSFFNSIASTISFKQLKHPMILNFEKVDVSERVSTCNGIICFRMGKSSALLFNPSIRKFTFLPPMKNSHLKNNYYTLVYDRFNNNHKIIALSLRYRHKIGVNVHTLGTDYWRKIQDLPYFFSDLKPGIFVSDTVNWLVYDIACLPRAILYFDLEKESCQELLYPLSHESFKTYVSLGALKDCLCIFSHNEKFFDIWMMKEYGNEKSWTKLFKIPYIGDPGFYWHTKALYIYEDDQVLVKFGKLGKFSLAVYDSKKDTFKILEIQNDIHYYVTEEVYVESLMSP